MVDRVEVALDVPVHDVSVAAIPQQANRFQRIRGAALRPKPVRAAFEVRLKDRLDHEPRRRLHHSVAHRRDPQRPCRPVRFRNVPASHRMRPIPTRPEALLYLQEKLLLASLLDHRQRLPVDAGSPSIALDPPPCLRQDITPTDPVVQRMEASRTAALGGHK
jgi:hypothetical protein